MPAPTTSLRPKPRSSKVRLKYPLESSNYKATINFQPLQVFSTLDILASRGGNPKAGETPPSLDVNGQLYGKATGQSIELPLSPGLPFNEGVDIQNANLQFVGTAILNAINNIDASSSVAKQIAAAAGAGIDNIKDQVKSMAELMKVTKGTAAINDTTRGLAARATSKFGDTLAGNTITASTRAVSNPNTRALFKSVEMREFSFQFVMTPTSEKEAAMIESIVYKFRYELYPDTYDGSTGAPLAYKFPNLFRITFKYDGRPMGNVPKILPCYLKGVSTNFNPEDAAFHPGGRFTQTVLNLQFMEYRTLDQKDIRGEERGYDIWDGFVDPDTGFNAGPDDGFRARRG